MERKVNINCIYYNNSFCKNWNVKRSFIRDRRRRCIIFPSWIAKCKYQKEICHEKYGNTTKR